MSNRKQDKHNRKPKDWRLEVIAFIEDQLHGKTYNVSELPIVQKSLNLLTILTENINQDIITQAQGVKNDNQKKD